MDDARPHDDRLTGEQAPKRRARRWLRWVALSLACALLALAAVPILTRGVPRAQPAIGSFASPVAAESTTLRVLSLNLAHGRGVAGHQLTLSAESITGHLDAIAGFLRAQGPDVVALQEADGPSWWSGGFNHVTELARKAAFGQAVRAENVAGLGLSYGTALLARPALSDPLALTFAPTWPTFSKGCMIASVAWPDRPELRVDVVSVHLDYRSRTARAEQLTFLAQALKSRGRPLILMGDFNCTWRGEQESLRRFAADMQLTTWQPEEAWPTFPGRDARLDWIFVSAPLQIASFQVHPEVLSDHLAISAQVRLAEEGE